MSDTISSETIPAPDALTLASDALWNKLREIIMPLVQLIAAKKEVFREAACSETLAEMYKTDALRQVEQLSQAESSLMYGLQLFRQSLYVRYLPAETKTPSVSPAEQHEEFYLARLNETLVN
jgi:hypothetical protein